MLWWNVCVTSAVKYLCLRNHLPTTGDGEKETKLFEKFP